MPYQKYTPKGTAERPDDSGWKCFCCHDHGTVVDVRGLPGGEVYSNTDPMVLCVRPSCYAALNRFGGQSAVMMDAALNCATPSECEMLHQRGLEDWRKGMVRLQADMSEVGAW